MVFTLTSVLVVVVVYAVAAWTMQAIAPRLVAVAAPMALALVARSSRTRPMQAALLVVLLGCLLLASWLVYRVSALPPDPGLFPWGA